MDLSRRLRRTVLVMSILVTCVHISQSRFHGPRLKRQNGANLYLPESSITPDGEGDPSEWTEWSSPSQCSRSCGGGVSFQTRECLRTEPNGTPLCSGGNRKYFSCNTQDCPEEESDFRAQQCSHFNHVPFDGIYYDWVPYTNAPNPCELNCMPVGERFYYRQKAKVIDGTRCNDKDLDVCVDGVCQPVGCDMMLGSNAKEDKCRKCGGDGSTCKTIADTFTTNNLAAGYNDILLIPNGATNIRVQETEPSNNYLACRNLTGHYYLNGNWRIDFPRPMFYAGCWWNYQRKPTGFAAPDHLTCSGPITESIYIVMLVQDKNVSIDYEYSIPEEVSRSAPDVYSWTHMEFGPCSASCGGGTQSRTVTCNNRVTLEEVDLSLCDANSRPAENQECGQEPCAPHWVEGEWGKCSKGCGEDGMQNRSVTCERISPNGDRTLEDEATCLKLVGNKPATVQECNRDVKNCPKYHLGPWSPCDKLCGEGKQKRKVTCYLEENGRKKVVGEEECAEEKPEVEKSCMVAPCEGVDWIISQWSGCEACGQNTETRTAICGSKSGKVYPDEFCAPEVPLLSRPCKSKKCQAQWFSSEWSKCSSECGKGVQSRIVLCGEFNGKSITPAADDSKCDAAQKPQSEQECTGEEKECPGEWFAGPWEECSKPCGGGEKVREVLCLANGTKSLNCDESKIESMSEKCNTDECLEGEIANTTSQPGENDYDDEEECSDEEDDDVEGVTGKMKDDLRIAEGIDLDGETTTLSSLITDELMLSDATSSDDFTIQEASTDLPFSTIEGSGDESSTLHEGSGDTSDVSTVDFTGSTEASSVSDQTHSTDLHSSTETSDQTGSTSASSDQTGTTLASSEQTGTTSALSDETGSTSASSDQTGTTSASSSYSTESSMSPASTQSTEFASTTTDISSVTTDGASSIDVSDSTTDSVSSVSADTTDVTTSSDVSSSSSGSTTTDVSETTDSSASSASTDGTTELSTGTDSSSSTSSTIDNSESTTDFTTASTETVSTLSTESTDSTLSTESTDSTLSTESTESTSEYSTESTESTTDFSTESTESTTDFSTESTESTTDFSTESTESTTEYSTESTESSTQHSTDSSVSSSSATWESTQSSEYSSISTESITATSETSLLTSDVTTDSVSGSTTDSSTLSDTTTDSSTIDASDRTTDTVSDVTTDVSAQTTETGMTTDVSATSIGSTDHSSDTTTAFSDTTSSYGSSEYTTTSGSGATDVSGTTDSSLSTLLSSDTTEGITTELSSKITSTDETTDVSGLSTISSATSDSSIFASSTSNTDLSSSSDSDFTGSTLESSTASSLSSEEDTTIDIWATTDDDLDKSSPNTLVSAITKATTQRKCKPKKRDCKATKYGCCPDNETVAKGAFDAGCPIAKTCSETKFGCCLDGVSPAKGKKYKGCPKSQCAETLFGCCPDKFTPAEGEDNEGCPEPTTVPPSTTIEITTDEPEISEATTTGPAEGREASLQSCSFSEFGCCPDGKTEARGKDFAGCEETPDSKDCAKSTHGCCPDSRTPASGPNREGCARCTMEQFGCCPDNQTPAHGPLGEGCCLSSPYGCCPDNINSARGPNYEDCDCKYTPYGCCPDNKTAARGPSNEGCGCEKSQYGCCPDKITPATGPKFEGCACHTMQFGCCPDGLTFAQGPHHYGCHCSQTEFQCCADEKTPAKGPNQEGCTCVESKYGCCPDGVVAAQGDKFEGCENVKEPIQKACGLPKETGPCGNFSIKYFFDTSYGACARFWYGGCDGNDNKFETESECKDTCQEYKGKDVCFLPKSSGPCTGYNKKWYFDSDRNRCEEFNYGGCYGTNNRFDSLEECQSTCTVSESIPPCEQPMEEGPCEGSFERWFYDNQTDVCRSFNYGGCKGNKNNYPTEHACNYHCRQPGVHKDFCSQPKQTGDCSDQLARWYYAESEKRCLPFYYTGCGGNKNNFPSQESCEDHCPKEVAKDVCEIPAEVGECTNYVAMWYFDTKDGRCRQFYYGGCGGNDNKFQTEDACMARCEKRPEPEPEPEPEKPTQSRGPQAPANVCDAVVDPGDCRDYVLQWYFDKNDTTCRQFYFGGCGGNGNRFNTQEECTQQCNTPQPPPAAAPPQTYPQENICEMEASPGDCDNYVLKWHYDPKEGRCSQFYYGGCGGNDNRFNTEEDCSRRCSNDTNIAPDNNVAVDNCFLPPEQGECEGNQTRWYYNSGEGLCDEFTYGGCGGNSNNYESEDDCQNDCFDRQPTCSLPPVRGRCSENSTRWYYDERSQRCYEFEFTGCRGNRNNFVTEAECMEYCSNEPTPNREPNVAPPQFSVCDLPVESGNCENYTTAWFYDSESLSCTAYTYSGCGGNGNRFETKEQCDRQCGEFKEIDVCNEPVVTGPCRQWQTRFYFNKETRTCEPFTYGGCDGTGNRFADRGECESVCVVGQELKPQSNQDICKLPVIIGKCNGTVQSERRWYYDDERGTCVSFIYAGCSGNQNNFRSYESCYSYCARPLDNEITNNEVVPNRCESYEEECRQLRCPFGTRRIPVDAECSRCECENPCEGYSCPEGQQCAVDISSDTSKQFVPICRDVNKPGECPQLAANSSNCARECYTDADCRADNKCCSDGCGFVCVRPSQPTMHTTRPTTPLPVVIYPGDVKASLEPKKPQEVDVNTAVGGIAVLRCFATGSPPPNVTWSHHNVVIDTNQGRYVLTANGDLTIVQVRQTDTGSYVCVASNGLGEPVRREVQLQVTEPQEMPAYVYGDKNSTQIVTLNRPAQVRCPAGGFPAPHVSWWRNRKRLGLVSDRFELTRDYSLMFRSIQLSDLGPYTCEVWNGRGRPASLKVVLKAIGPARAVNNDEAPYLQYILDPVTAPVTHRPSYPYRPTRPSVVPPPVIVVVPPRSPSPVPVQAVLALDPRNTYSPGSTIVMNCAVQGYPTPNVTWIKDSVPLVSNDHIQITSQPYRLVINDATPEDSGVYGCTARNPVSYGTSQEQLTIESTIPVNPECVDNPYFANCQLIVRGHYCRNHYYAKFCCRSCTLAGQLALPHPNAV